MLTADDQWVTNGFHMQHLLIGVMIKVVHPD